MPERGRRGEGFEALSVEESGNINTGGLIGPGPSVQPETDGI